MKTSRHHPSTSHIPLKLLGIYGGVLAALFLLFALAAHLLRMGNAGNHPLPDETAAARELLEAKLSGPAYFQFEDGSEVPRPYLTVAQTRMQTERVSATRQLSAEQRQELDRLIERLTEPSPSRMVGTERLNALKLNLALDEMK